MRAIVIEIHKNYCIAVTPDGRFIKQRIAQGELEIGDEIIVESGITESSRAWIKTLSIAAATIAVIAFGSWGLVKAFGMYLPARTAVYDTAAVQEEAMEAAAEDTAAESTQEVQAGEEVSDKIEIQGQQVDEVPSGPGAVDADFYLMLGNLGEPVEVTAGNLLFLYWVVDSQEEGIEILVTIEELDPELAFTGYIEVFVLDHNNEVTNSESFDLEEFSRGDRIQEYISAEDVEGSLNILINGKFE